MNIAYTTLVFVCTHKTHKWTFEYIGTTWVCGILSGGPCYFLLKHTSLHIAVNAWLNPKSKWDGCSDWHFIYGDNDNLTIYGSFLQCLCHCTVWRRPYGCSLEKKKLLPPTPSLNATPGCSAQHCTKTAPTSINKPLENNLTLCFLP